MARGTPLRIGNFPMVVGQGHSSHTVADARQLLDQLRERLGGGQTAGDGGAGAMLDQVEADLTRLATEHTGMADEVLRTYEQLGIVFEVTRCLSHVHTENEVVALFVNNLAITYPFARVTIVEPNEQGEFNSCVEGQSLAPAVQMALRRCRNRRQVVPVADTEFEEGELGVPQSRGLARAICGPIFANDDFLCALLLDNRGREGASRLRRSFDSSDLQLIDALSVFCGDLIANFRLLNELRQLSVDMVRALVAAIEQKDEYTCGHSNRVGTYAVMLGRELGLGAKDLQQLEWSALLHDVGKIGIRDEVLKKTGKLTEAEFEHIKEHPQRSFQVVQQVPQLTAALDGVVYHHEHYDGSGYPYGLKGEAIPLQARIIQVADVFDALTSTRSYRQAYSWPKALEILQEEEGRTIDPRIGAVFEQMIRRLAEQKPQDLAQLMQYGRACGCRNLVP